MVDQLSWFLCNQHVPQSEALLERQHAFACSEVLVMVMRKHQRYFPLYKPASQDLLPHFITVANGPIHVATVKVSFPSMLHFCTGFLLRCPFMPIQFFLVVNGPNLCALSRSPALADCPMTLPRLCFGMNDSFTNPLPVCPFMPISSPDALAFTYLGCLACW